MLDIEDRSGTAIIRLQHGKVNALDLELLQALTAAMRDTSDAQAIVITGAGPTFSAGVDLRRISAGGAPYIEAFVPALTGAFMAVFDDPRPVVAAVNGHAIAGGCVIAAACDLRLMSQGSIGLAELSVGVPFSPRRICTHQASAPATSPHPDRIAAERGRLFSDLSLVLCRSTCRDRRFPPVAREPRQRRLATFPSRHLCTSIGTGGLA